MITLSHDEIPNYLREGAFYSALSAEESDGEIQVPDQCYSRYCSVSSAEDFTKLLRVTAFWGLDRIPVSLIEYCIQMESSTWSTLIQEEQPEWQFAQDLVKVFARDPTEDDNQITRAIRIGRTDVLEYLVKNYECDILSCQAAAEVGRVDYLQLLHRNQHPWDEEVCIFAVKRNHLDCLQYLHSNGCPWDQRVHYYAAKFHSLECMKYACEQGLAWNDNVSYYIAEAGNLTMLKYAVDNGCPLHEQAADIAAECGHVDCLRYLLEAGCSVPRRSSRSLVCEKGYLPCLQVMQEYGAEWDRWHIEDAAHYGQFECVQYLHENGCLWDEQAAVYAAEIGRLDILCYILENGCPVDEPDYLLEAAVETVSQEGFECLKYLIEERNFAVKKDTSLFITAFTHGNYLAMQYLIDRKEPFKRIDRVVRIRWYDQLHGLYEALQENEVDGVFPHYPTCAEYDTNLVKCIQCVVAHNWKMETYGGGLGRFVMENEATLPLSFAYLKPWLDLGLGTKKRKRS